jgi:hypothetical protein
MKDQTTIIKEIGLDETKLSPFETLSKQCKTEYTLAWLHQKPKKDEWEVRLKLYNNQKRDKSAVGDTTMFTIHQTILASLYVDRLDVIFGGKEQGDEEVAENLNSLAENDYDEMGKDIIDYDWDWDTLFFGRGLLDTSEWKRDVEKKIYIPTPYVIDPIPFLRDPLARSVNGDEEGRGSARFFGYEQKMTKKDMQDHPHIFSDIKFEEIKFGSGTQSILRDAIDARAQAQGLQTFGNKELQEANLGANAAYDITKWYTNYEVDGKVKKVIVWLANDRTKVVGFQILKTPYWPIVDRPLYPTSHDWDGTSIPDLTEDKQRARAIAQNLGLDAMKADLYPMYIYDSNRITNRNDLNFNFNKFIPIDAKEKPVGDSIMPLMKARPNLQLLDFIYTSLDVSAQKATATPEIQQGAMSKEQRTLGELNLISSKVDTRFSLSAKVFGWSEKRFWGIHWYGQYKENFTEEIDEKVLRIEGAFGAKWRPLKRDNIIAKVDPDVKIESRVLSRAKQLEERQAMTVYFGVALSDPTANRRWGLKKLGKLNGLKRDEIDRLFPPTIDEREAEDENVVLNEDKQAQVLREQDHNIHLEIHAKANLTKATEAHIATHEKALMIRRTNPELFPENPQETAYQAPGTEQLAPAQGGQARQPMGMKPSQSSNVPMA